MSIAVDVLNTGASILCIAQAIFTAYKNKKDASIEARHVEQFQNCLVTTWEQTVTKSKLQNSNVPDCFYLDKKTELDDVVLQNIKNELNALSTDDKKQFMTNFRRQLSANENQELYRYLKDSNNQDLLKVIRDPDRSSVSFNYILTPDAVRWNTSILGRKDFIDSLCKKICEPQKDNNKRSIQLTGMGGIGKTEILRGLYKYYLDNRTESNFDYVAFLNYDGSIEVSLTQIKDNNGENVENVWAHVQRLCETASVLFLIDDIRWTTGKGQSSHVDEKLGELLSLATVVFASRALDDNLMKQFTCIEQVKPLSIDDCKKIFKNNCYGDKDYNLSEADEQILSGIMEKQAGCNPFVVMRLGTIARSYDSGKYGSRITGLVELLKVQKFDVHRRFNDTVTFQTEINKLYPLKDIKDAKDMCLLEAFALFPNIPLKGEMCEQWLHEDANMNSFDCAFKLNELANRTWLIRQEYQHDNSIVVFYSMHQLVQAAIIAQTKINVKEHDKLIGHLLDAVYSVKDTFDIVEMSMPYAISVAGYFYKNQGYSAGLAFLTEGIVQYYAVTDVLHLLECEWLDNTYIMWEKVLGKKNLENNLKYFLKKKKELAIKMKLLCKVAEIDLTYNMLITLDSSVMDVNAGFAHIFEQTEKSLPALEKLYGKEHPVIASSYASCAVRSRIQGDFVKALEWYDKARIIQEKVLGKDKPATAVTYYLIAESYDIQGDFVKALEWYEKARIIREKTLGIEHPDTICTYDNIGVVYWKQGDYVKALKWYEKVRDIREKTLGNEHPDTATTYNKIGVAYYRQDNYSKAIEWYEKARIIREKTLGIEHPDTANTYNDIANVYHTQGDYVKALEWYEKARIIHEKVSGKENPNTATIYDNIAKTHYTKGDFVKALGWYEQARIIREKTLGNEHLDTITTYNNIANTYYVQVNYIKALEWFEKIRAIREKVSGKEHPDTATTYNSIGTTHYAQGNYSKAIEWYEKARIIRENVLDKEHPDTLTTYNNIALAYSFIDEVKALEWCEKIRAIREKISLEHPDTTATYLNIANAHRFSDKYAKALEWYDKTRIIREKVSGKENPNTVAIYHNIADVYSKQGDFVKALEWYEKVRAIREKMLGEEHADTVNIYRFIADVYSKQGDFVKALEWYEKVRIICEKVWGKENLYTLFIYSYIAEVYSKQGDFVKALELYEKKRAIQEKDLDKNCYNIPVTYSSIAEVYDKQGDYVKALEWYQKALIIREADDNQKYGGTIETYSRIAKVHCNQGDFVKALEWYEKVRISCEEGFGKEHFNTAITYNNIGMVYYLKKEYAPALDYLFKSLSKIEEMADHSTTISTYDAIFNTYYEQGEYAKSLEYGEKCLNAKLKFFDKNSVEVAFSFSNIGFTYRMLKNYERALYNHFEALKICVNLFGENGEATCVSYKRIADTYKDSGDNNQAITYYLKATNNSANAKEVYLSLSKLYEQTGEYEKAQEYKQKTESL